MHHVHSTPVEARAWLTSNPSPNGFGGNRFESTARALAFVEELYQRGASQVLVDAPGVDSEGSPYADTLLVRFPMTGDTKWDIERFCEREGPGDVPEGDFTIQVLEREIVLWWD